MKLLRLRATRHQEQSPEGWKLETQQEQTETAETETEISVFSVTSLGPPKPTGEGGCSKSLGALPGADQRNQEFLLPFLSDLLFNRKDADKQHQ